MPRLVTHMLMDPRSSVEYLAGVLETAFARIGAGLAHHTHPGQVMVRNNDVHWVSLVDFRQRIASCPSKVFFSFCRSDAPQVSGWCGILRAEQSIHLWVDLEDDCLHQPQRALSFALGLLRLYSHDGAVEGMVLTPSKQDEDWVGLLRREVEPVITPDLVAFRADVADNGRNLLEAMREESWGPFVLFYRNEGPYSPPADKYDG